MEQLIQYSFEHPYAAQGLFMLLILMAGINFPISIDIVLISAGAFCSISNPDSYIFFFLLCMTCWVSAWQGYWLGRLLGPKLYHIRLFSHVLSKDRIEKLHYYYEKFGFFTFLVGRFIPGGVRNALFMTSGLGKMPFQKFVIRDLPACFLSTGFLYSLGYYFGLHYEVIINTFKTYNKVIVVSVVVLILSLVVKPLIVTKSTSKP